MDLEQENEALRRQLLEMNRQAHNYQAALRRCHERALDLLSANSLPELLNSLTEGMLDSFQVKTIQLILADPDHVIRHLLQNSGMPEAAFPKVQFVDDLEHHNLRYCGLRNPWLGPFREPEHISLFSDHSELRSMAILPIFCRGQLIGSLNLGSSNSERFTRKLASDFLAHLATVSGVCLENAINREHLVVSGLTDPLTGLHNRRYLDRRLEEELARASRYRQPLSCLFVDADHFKQINDIHGHQAGDQALRELANRIRSQLRASDVATRFGGEEFALLLPQTSLDEAMMLAERIRLEVSSKPVVIESGVSLPLTVSIGVSETLPMLGKAPNQNVGEHLLASADHALYEAKAKGRNRVEHTLQPGPERQSRKRVFSNLTTQS